MYVKVKCIEKENVCFEEARRESIKEDKKKDVHVKHLSIIEREGGSRVSGVPF